MISIDTSTMQQLAQAASTASASVKAKSPERIRPFMGIPLSLSFSVRK